MFAAIITTTIDKEMSSKKYLPGPESYREFGEMGPRMRWCYYFETQQSHMGKLILFYQFFGAQSGDFDQIFF